MDEGVAHKVQTIDNLPKAKPAYSMLKPVIGSTSILTLEGEHLAQVEKNV